MNFNMAETYSEVSLFLDDSLNEWVWEDFLESREVFSSACRESS